MSNPRTSQAAPTAVTTLASVLGDPFEALADEHRRSIVEMLRDGERPVQHLADQLPISRPAVSRHLRVLKLAGFVTDRPEGTRRLYRLDDAGVQVIRDYVDGIWTEAIRNFVAVAEATVEEGAPDDR